MKLGLFNLNFGAAAVPDRIIENARAAEQAGFDSVWMGEHIVLPDPQEAPSPMGPHEPVLDSLLALAWVAAHTTTLRLATGIVILPQRNPVVLAKEVATLDVLSGGRVMLGVGAGYLEPEFAAVGASFAERGAITDEYLDALERLWYDEQPRHLGRYVSFAGIDARPRPVQRPVPIVVGGHSAPAFRRAVTRAAGWYGFALTPEAAAACIEGLREAAARHARPAELGALEITVTPRGRMRPEKAAAFAELGVHRLVPMFRDEPGAALATIEASVAAVAAL